MFIVRSGADGAVSERTFCIGGSIQGFFREWSNLLVHLFLLFIVKFKVFEPDFFFINDALLLAKKSCLCVFVGEEVVANRFFPMSDSFVYDW